MPPRLSAAWRAAPMLLLLPLLGACAPKPNTFAPACPAAAVVPPTDQIAQYRPNGSGRGLTDLVLQGRVERIEGRCRPGGKGKLDAAVSVTFDFSRGPAMQGDRLTVPVFVAVTQGRHVLAKKIYTVAASFPRNVDQLRYSTHPVDMTLPVSARKSGAAYTIVAGFQLTRDQLAASRAPGG